MYFECKKKRVADLAEVAVIGHREFDEHNEGYNKQNLLGKEQRARVRGKKGYLGREGAIGSQLV